VHYDFELTAADEAHVGRICRLVYGMPLGVELAASWVDMLPLADIAAEIEQSLDFLEATVRNIPTRQRSLRAVFDTTWQRLTPEEQTTFVRLSVFRGGFTREAGQRITGASLMMLSKLVNKSLVQFNRDKERYEVHELLRQYGAERLAQNPAAAETAREQHSVYYCQLLHTLQSSIEGADKRTALAAIEADIENIHAAWDWALSCCHYERLGQAMSSLEHFYYWQARIYQAEERFRRAMERLGEGLGDTPTVTAERVFAGVQARYANFTTLLGNWDRGKELYQRSLDIIERLLAAGHDVREDKAYLLMKMGDVAESLELAQERFAESLDLYGQVGHTWWCAGLHCHLSYIAIAAGRYEEAQRGFEESLATYQSLSDRWQQGW